MNLRVEMVKDLHKEVEQLKFRLDAIENSLKDSEGELSQWSKKQLSKARKQPLSTYTKL